MLLALSLIVHLHHRLINVKQVFAISATSIYLISYIIIIIIIISGLMYTRSTVIITTAIMTMKIDDELSSNH